MVDGAYPLGQGADRFVVGDVDDFGGDSGVVVGAGELVLVAPGDDDPRTLCTRKQGDGACDPLPRPTTTTVLSCNVLPTTEPLDYHLGRMTQKSARIHQCGQRSGKSCQCLPRSRQRLTGTLG
jgi:hypothetical protein